VADGKTKRKRRRRKALLVAGWLCAIGLPLAISIVSLLKADSADRRARRAEAARDDPSLFVAPVITFTPSSEHARNEGKPNEAVFEDLRSRRTHRIPFPSSRIVPLSRDPKFSLHRDLSGRSGARPRIRRAYLWLLVEETDGDCFKLRGLKLRLSLGGLQEQTDVTPDPMATVCANSAVLIPLLTFNTAAGTTPDEERGYLSRDLRADRCELSYETKTLDRSLKRNCVRDFATSATLG
jgi:hypothetical protein